MFSFCAFFDLFDASNSVCVINENAKCIQLWIRGNPMELLIINFELNDHDAHSLTASHLFSQRRHMSSPLNAQLHTFGRDSGRCACIQHAFWTRKKRRCKTQQIPTKHNCIYELATANYEVSTEHALVSNKNRNGIKNKNPTPHGCSTPTIYGSRMRRFCFFHFV